MRWTGRIANCQGTKPPLFNTSKVGVLLEFIEYGTVTALWVLLVAVVLQANYQPHEPVLAASTCGIQDSPNCPPSWIGHLCRKGASAHQHVPTTALSFFADCLQFVVNEDAHLKEMVAKVKVKVSVEELKVPVKDAQCLARQQHCMEKKRTKNINSVSA